MADNMKGNKLQDDMASIIGKQIRILMIEHDWTQADLAQAMGVGQAAVSMMLSRGTYSLATLTQVADAFGVRLEIKFVPIINKP